MKRSTLGWLALVAAFAVAPQALEAQNCWVRGNLADRPSPLDSAVVAMGDDVVKVCLRRPLG